MLEKGQIVRNPDQPQWGSGRVLQMAGPGKAQIQFEDGQVRLLDPTAVTLEIDPSAPATAEKETRLFYLFAWEEEYKQCGTVQIWKSEFPSTFDGSCGTMESLPSFKSFGTLANFPNYALMYLLRKNEGIHSVTYFELGHNAKTSSTKSRRERLQGIMRKWMGGGRF
jgi:hypothetical protein